MVVPKRFTTQERTDIWFSWSLDVAQVIVTLRVCIRETPRAVTGHTQGIMRRVGRSFGWLTLKLFLGWWWSDSVAALLMVPIIANEGIEAIRGRECSC